MKRDTFLRGLRAMTVFADGVTVELVYEIHNNFVRTDNTYKNAEIEIMLRYAKSYSGIIVDDQRKPY